MSEMEEDLSGIASEPLAHALQALIAAMRDDPEYAWAWHSNIAMALYDGGLKHDHANALAASLMIKLFDRDTTQSPHWREMFGHPVPNVPMPEG